MRLVDSEFTLFQEVVREEYKLIKYNRGVLKKHQPDLIDIISLDIVSTAPLLATLSSNLLSSIAVLHSHTYMEDKDDSWVFHLARNGRFARLIRTLGAEDEDLAEAIYIEGLDKTNLIYKYLRILIFVIMYFIEI